MKRQLYFCEEGKTYTFRTILELTAFTFLGELSLADIGPHSFNLRSLNMSKF